jgi:hypothetical protein
MEEAMPRTIDHLVETHRIAAERRAAGKRHWAHRLTVTRYTDGTFEQNRDEFAGALKCSSWFRASTKEESEDSELWQMWDEIKDAETVDHFDSVLDDIYDLADLERCVISFARTTVPAHDESRPA